MKRLTILSIILSVIILSITNANANASQNDPHEYSCDYVTFHINESLWEQYTKFLTQWEIIDVEGGTLVISTTDNYTAVESIRDASNLRCQVVTRVRYLLDGEIAESRWAVYSAINGAQPILPPLSGNFSAVTVEITDMTTLPPVVHMADDWAEGNARWFSFWVDGNVCGSYAICDYYPSRQQVVYLPFLGY
jgi:hypothetical protein